MNPNGFAAAVVLAAALGGCSDLESVDHRVDALVSERSSLLGPGTRVPSRRLGEPGDLTPRSIVTTPDTVNPDASALRFSAADEARDVEGRLAGYAKPVADARTLDLRTAWRQTQLTAREFLNAEEDYILTAIRLLVERHAFDLQLFGNTTAAVDSTNTPGEFNQSVPLSILNQLGLTKNLPDGGRVAATMIWEATDLLRTSSTGRYTQASRLVLSGEIPLLRGAGAVAREELIQAERELVYAARTFEDFRRSFLVQVARDYFALVQQQALIRNQERQLESLRQLQQRTAALVEAGRLAEFERNIAASRVLQAASTLTSLRENFILATDRFKVRLGIDAESAVQIAPFVLTLPEPDITPEDATRLALDYRLDLQTRRDRLEDARRTVAFRKSDLLPDARLFGSTTFRTKPSSSDEFAPREGGFVYEPEDIQLRGGISVDWGLDREVERLTVRQAQILQQQRERDLSLTRDNIIVEVRARVREIDRARFALKLAEESVTINRRRLEEQELKKDEVTAQQVVETENDLLAAENSRDQAVTDLRNAILNYLVSSGQMRVARDGTLQPLPGMVPEANPENATSSPAPEEPPVAPAAATPAPVGR